MSRRKRVYKKEERVDSRYGSPAVARLITTVMKRGKKSLAERIVYTAIEKSREGSDSVDPLEVVNKAIENVRPRLEAKSRRVGGATYQVPMEVTPARQISLATRWIVQYADNRKGMPMAEALAHEIKDAADGQGNARKKAFTKFSKGSRSGSTLSTLLATSILPLKWNVRCAFSMAPSPFSTAWPVFSHSPRQCGDRRPNTMCRAWRSSIRWTASAR